MQTHFMSVAGLCVLGWFVCYVYSSVCFWVYSTLLFILHSLLIFGLSSFMDLVFSLTQT